MRIEASDVSLEVQAQILHAKQEWEETFDAVSDLIFIVDNNHTILRVNRAMAEHFALSPKDLVGRKCFEVMHGTISAPDECPHARMLSLGQPQTSQFTDKYINGVLEVTTSPRFNREGEITASVHVAKDVTEKRHHEELQAEHHKQLKS